MGPLANNVQFSVGSINLDAQRAN